MVRRICFVNLAGKQQVLGSMPVDWLSNAWEQGLANAMPTR